MRGGKSEQQALIGLINRLYQEIQEVEAAHDVLVGGGDFRPRIEYFHDAIRALTSGSDDVYAEQGRLSVESLAYDVATLRHIQSVPLQPARQGRQSPSTQVSTQLSAQASPRLKDRELKLRLSDLYKSYCVMFVALLAEPAARNYQTRVEDKDAEVEELAQIMAILQEMAQGKGQGQEQTLEALVSQLEQEELKHILMAVLHQRSQQKKQHIQTAQQKLKEVMAGADRTIASIEAAHMNYCMAQLAVYEDSKDVVKKMAAQGMNIVGQFVESAMQEAQRGMRGGRNR